jgi:hypothetical protein
VFGAAVHVPSRSPYLSCPRQIGLLRVRGARESGTTRSARIKLPIEMVPGASHDFLQPDGRIKSFSPDFHTLSYRERR